MIFERFFKKLKAKEQEDHQENQIKGKNSYLEEYLNIKNEIDHIESKYDDMVLRSLELDFDDFKRLIDNGVPIKQGSYEFWHFEKIQFDEFRLVKYTKTQYGKKYINLDVKFEFYSDTFKLSKVQLDYTFLDEEKFKDILESYFMYYKLNEIKKSKQRTLDKYDKVISIIGKDVKRDSIIDQLLNGE